ncbi:MAG TPA: hypothetical protein VHL52_08690 [Acidimicrobiia bacterium]|nr:hypothetical protein [Acidimicrobiia bacterium]
MLHIDNETVSAVLHMEDAVAALRNAYLEYARGRAALVPRADLWAPTDRTDGYYCLGTMAGTSAELAVTALRIKSDVTYWPGGRTQEKFAKEPGLYCGFILLFDNATGSPLAIINDGILQHTRVGAAAGVALDYTSAEDAKRLGLIGSGGMAETMLAAALVVRGFQRIDVFSLTASHRDRFVTSMQSRYPDVEFRAVSDVESAVRGADVVISATDSMVPTLDPSATKDDVTVVTVSRREIGADDLDAFARVLQLGRHTFPPHEGLPEMEYPQSGMAGFVAGTSEQRARLPWKQHADMVDRPTLIELIGSGESLAKGEGRTLVINTGTQGVQFAAISALVFAKAKEKGLGTAIPEEMFLQNIRD